MRAWEVRTKIDERGWSAEFAIPFRTLRFPAGVDQVVGRELPAQHPPPERARLLGADSAAVQLVPPVAGRIGRRHSDAGDSQLQGHALRARAMLVDSGVKPTETKAFGDVGGDFKYNLTPSLTLDATINTDFAQVEVDDQQVNLDRFTLFFPEKRPFFLENAGFFSVGNPGEVDLFFSRRIGIGDDEPADSDPRRRPRVGQGRATSTSAC